MICIIYIQLVQEKEDKGEEEEQSANIIPKWKAGQVTAIHLQTEEDMEEETKEEESTEGGSCDWHVTA